MKRVWEALLLMVLIMIAVNVIAASVQPFLPIFGLFVVGLVIFLVVRFLMRRRF